MFSHPVDRPSLETLNAYISELENKRLTESFTRCLSLIEYDLTALQRRHDLSAQIQRLVKVGEVRRKIFNSHIKKNPDGALFKVLSPYPHLFDLNVRIMVVMRYESTATELERCQLLEECMVYMVTPYKVAELSEQVIHLILSIKNTFAVLRIAERNRKIINEILRQASKGYSAKELYIIFANSSHMLDVDVKCTYYHLKHSNLDPDSLMELMNDCLAQFETLKVFTQTIECLKTLLALFEETTIDTRLAKAKFLRIAVSQKEYINRFLLDTHNTEVYSMLKSCPDLMDIQVTAKYIDTFDDDLDMWDSLIAELLSLSTAADVSQKLKLIQSIEVMSDALGNTKIEKLKLFAEEHKEIINDIHRNNLENLPTNGVLVRFAAVLDNDILIKYLKYNHVISYPTEENLKYMLTVCVEELQKSSEEEQIVTLLPAIDRLLNLLGLLKGGLTLIKNELVMYATGLVLTLAQYDDLFDIDNKNRYIDIIVPQMTKQAKFKFVLECLESIGDKSDIWNLENAISKAAPPFVVFHDRECRYFAETHKDLINNILYRYVPKVKRNPIFGLIRNYQELWSMDIMIKFAHELKTYYYEDTKWEIIEKCLEDPEKFKDCLETLVRHIFHKRTATMMHNTEKLIHFIKNHGKILRKVVNNDDICPYILPLVMEHGTPMDFEEKLNYLHDKTKFTSRYSIRINIDRNNIVTSSFTKTSMLTEEDWKNRILINFINEDGVDCGGLTREWFTILSREMFNPNYVLFTTAPGDPNSYMINKASHVNPEHLEYFAFFGRIIAKSIIEKQRVHCNFTKAFYKQILSIPVECSDLESQDPMFFKSMYFMLKHPTEQLNMDLTFSTEVQEFGETIVKDLMYNGRNIAVTDDNKEEYVRLISQMKMTESIREQLVAFRQGFHSLIPHDVISIFTPDELEILIAGQPNIDVNNLEANTEYKDYEPTDEHILWFWRALKSFNVVERSKFLMFTTGSPNAPLLGFGALLGSSGVQKFTISKDDRDGNRLPTASTCINRLTLPQYDSYSSMRAAILTAIEEGTEGFHVE